MPIAKWSSIVGLLLMALVLTGSILPRRPDAGGCFWPNADFCEDFENSASSLCTDAPVDACAVASSCDDSIEILGSPDCKVTTSVPEGSFSGQLDGNDAGSLKWGFDDQQGDRSPDLDCPASVDTCQWRMKIGQTCSSSAGGNHLIFLVEGGSGEDLLNLWFDCTSATEFFIGFEVLGNTNVNTASITEGIYNLCIDWTPSGGVDTADATLYGDPGATSDWCIGNSFSATKTNATGTPVAAQTIRWRKGTGDFNFTLNIDTVGFDEAGTF